MGIFLSYMFYFYCMKTLVIVRHAKSSWANIGQADFDRPLNERGKKDAPEMAKRLKEKHIKPDAFISSPAKRAKRTCEAFCDIFNFDKEKIHFIKELYHAPEKVFYSTIHNTNNKYNTIAIFSHNPGITDFANTLCDGVNIHNIPTCGVFVVKADIDDWKNFVHVEKRFLFFDYPKSVEEYS